MKTIFAFLISLFVYDKAISANDMLQKSNLLSQYRSNSDNEFKFNSRRGLVDTDGLVLGVPTHMSHLPEAAAILPGHTLIKPALGMLKSAVKFPHREYENGAGVYGNVKNLGLAYAGTNERLLYSGFRRMPSDYILVEAAKGQPSKNSRADLDFSVSSLVLDTNDDADKVQRLIEKHLEKFGRKRKNLNLLSLLNIGVDSKVSEQQSNPNVYLKKVLSFDIRKTPKNHQDGKYKYGVLHHIFKALSKLRRFSDDENEFSSYKEVKHNHGVTFHSPKANMNPSFENPEVDGEPTESSTLHLHTSAEKNKNKLEQFYETQDMFNHVRLNQDAPDIQDLLPDVDKQLENPQKWWFYSQDDFTSLTQNNDEGDLNTSE